MKAAIAALLVSLTASAQVLQITDLPFFAGNGCTNYYTTSFAGATEVPISEGGKWGAWGFTTGIDWSDVAVTNTATGGAHMAIGAQINAGGGGLDVNDSEAVLAGNWCRNQTASATLFFDRSGTLNTHFIEVELRLNTTITAHSSTGYEIDFSGNIPPKRTGYIFITSWDGAYNVNHGIGPGTNGPALNLNSGDIISASNSNGWIRCYLNGTNFYTQNTATDTVWSAGSPGIGFDMGDGWNLSYQYGITNFTAGAWYP